jgi:hypothetical protein
VLAPGGPPELDAFVRSSFSRVLNRMGEPSLSCEPASADTYRLVLIPAWGGAKAVRITTTLPEAFLTVAHSSPEQGPPTRMTRSLNRADAVEEISRALRNAEFWTLPTAEEDYLCRDGVMWILEGRSAAAYHVVYRACPESGSFRDLGLPMLRMAGAEPM